MTQNNDKPVQQVDRISFERSVRTLRNACINVIDQLYDEGRPELSAPFARILGTLAEIDHDALKFIDEDASRR